MVTAKLLSEEEAEVYRNMPVGFSQSATAIRSVAEQDGIKQILEITAKGYNRIKVKE